MRRLREMAPSRALRNRFFLVGGILLFWFFAIREIAGVLEPSQMASFTDLDQLAALATDVATRIREHFPDGVDGLADGAVQNELVVPAVRDGGAVTSVKGVAGVAQRGIAFTATMVHNYDGEYEKLDRLRRLVEGGAVTLRVAATYPPERAGEAHARLEAGGTRGRLVIEF